MNFFHLGQKIEGFATPDIQSELCSRVLSPLSSCQSCRDVCPAQALTFTEHAWHATDCQGCGLCVTACPNHVFRLDEDALLNAASPDTPLTVSCRRNPAPYATDLVIECFQQLYPELVLRLLEQTRELVLFADSQVCAACPNHWLPQSLTLQLLPFGLPLDHLKIMTAPQEYTAYSTASSEKSSRRDFLRQMLHDTKHSSQKAVVHSAEQLLNDLPVDTPPAAPTPVLPFRRVPLRAIYARHDSQSIASSDLPYRQLSADYCTFCGACTSLCPTQALTIRQSENRKELLFQPILCTQCRLCQDACMHKKLYWSDRLTIGALLDTQPQILAAADGRICTQCEHPFWQYPNESDICSFCRRS